MIVDIDDHVVLYECAKCKEDFPRASFILHNCKDALSAHCPGCRRRTDLRRARQRALAVPCRHCHVDAGRWCMRPGKKETKIHAVRAFDGDLAFAAARRGGR